MRFLIAFIIFFSINLIAKDVIELYRTSGLQEVEKYLEAELKSRNYWLKRLQNIETDYGFYEDLDYFLLCNKYLKDFKLYKIDNNKFKFMSSTNAIVGKMGDKEKEGDLKTPVGVYDLTQKLSNVDKFYGPLAFVTSYPNTYDKIRGKDGHGIWIHGVPLNNGKRDDNTKGCIALENEYLSNLESEINFKKSLLIIAEDGLQKVSKNELAIILSSLYKWREAWKLSDVDSYLSFYNKNFQRYDKLNFEDFKKYKDRIFKRKQEKIIKFSNINIAPYPNLYNEKLFRITFFEDYQTKSYQFRGNKELYVKVIDNKMSIILEK